jgi:hypothetical protein
MIEKLCIWCSNCEMTIDGYDTSGYYPVMNCEKGHWGGSYGGIPGKATMFLAQTCKDYEERKE